RTGSTERARPSLWCTARSLLAIAQQQHEPEADSAAQVPIPCGAIGSRDREQGEQREPEKQDGGAGADNDRDTHAHGQILPPGGRWASKDRPSGVLPRGGEQRLGASTLRLCPGSALSGELPRGTVPRVPRPQRTTDGRDLPTARPKLA